jgi:hypothetical protein
MHVPSQNFASFFVLLLSDHMLIHTFCDMLVACRGWLPVDVWAKQQRTAGLPERDTICSGEGLSPHKTGTSAAQD